MVRKKRESGKDSFELTPEKANKMHDDRAYTACLISYALMQERRKSITGKKKKSTSNLADILPIRTRSVILISINKSNTIHQPTPTTLQLLTS